jgi:hypothetical protein
MDFPAIRENLANRFWDIYVFLTIAAVVDAIEERLTLRALRRKIGK